MNDAFNGLMDLALSLNIPSRAISLDGSLGLAFGARGRGGKRAAAHYEPSKVVINLTKSGGPGTLAHEWWHALDSYFSKHRGERLGFITKGPMTPARKTSIDNAPYSDLSVRKPMLDAFQGIMAAIEQTGLAGRSKKLDASRTKPYWGSPIELSARVFENFIIDRLSAQGVQNDYLANIADIKTFGEKSYPYLTEEEMPGVNKAFDHFFDTLEADESGYLFSRKVNKTRGTQGEAQGAYNPRTDTLHLKDTEDRSGVFLHEIFHRGLQKDPQLIKVRERLLNRMDRLHRQAKNGTVPALSKFYKRAQERVAEAGVKESLTAEEFAAYAIEEYENAPRSLPEQILKWVTDLIAQVKVYLIRAGMDIKNITPADLTALARQSVTRQGTLKVKGFDSQGIVDAMRMFSTKGVSNAVLEREYNETRDRYINTPHWLKAPNGKLTKLNERNWVLVRTPRFKKWFGEWE